MTSKEKALDITQKMGVTTMFDSSFNNGYTLPLHVAKKCALVFVEEMMIKLRELNHSTPLDYWKDVKEEIDNL